MDYIISIDNLETTGIIELVFLLHSVFLSIILQRTIITAGVVIALGSVILKLSNRTYKYTVNTHLVTAIQPLLSLSIQ
jgi:hypothetical protein